MYSTHLRQDVIKEIQKLTDGYGCDVYIEASGSEPSVRQGLEMIRNLGRYVAVGVFPTDITIDWNIIGDTKEIDVRGSHLSGHCYDAVIKGIADGTIRTDGVVTHIYKLDVTGRKRLKQRKRSGMQSRLALQP